MKFRKVDDRYFVYIEKEESVLKTLTDFCSARKINNGQVFGIGAIKDVELGAFDPETKQYTRKVFTGCYELISFQGNIMLLDDKPFIHAHVTISDHNFKIKGGHLFAAIVAAVGEFIVLPLAGDARREPDPEIGLATWKL